ncbi:MAG: DUF4397 domain-containing protein [Gemmatimonadaceae bacterium]|nr:DUF4397 domain-containing protein [Gemmatimonadaceae bacterium]
MTHTSVALRRVAAAALALGGLAACSSEDGPTVTETPPLAYVRVINAIPDTTAMIYGFRDEVENPIEGSGLAFRQGSSYKGTRAGQRLLRSFVVSSVPAIVAGDPVINQTLTLRPNTYYTVLHVGLAQGNRDSLIVLEDSIPRAADLGQQVAIRAVHAIPGAAPGPVQVFVTDTTSDAVGTALATINFGARTGYVRRAAGRAAAQVRAVADPSVILRVQMQRGTPGDNVANPEGGVAISGSAMSVVAFPAGLGQRATAFASPGLVSFLDGRPTPTIAPIRP